MVFKYLNFSITYKNLKKLEQCYFTKKWLESTQANLCGSGINHQYKMMVYLLLMILGLFWLAAIFYLAENVVKGLDKYEKKFVKTNRQRFDWAS